MPDVSEFAHFPAGHPDAELECLLAYLKFEHGENTSGVRELGIEKLRAARLTSVIRVVEFYRDVRNDPACLRQMATYAGWAERSADA